MPQIQASVPSRFLKSLSVPSAVNIHSISRNNNKKATYASKNSDKEQKQPFEKPRLVRVVDEGDIVDSLSD